MDPRPSRNEPLIPNVGFVARREYARARSRPAVLRLDARPRRPRDVRRGPAGRGEARSTAAATTTVAVVVDRPGAVAPDPRRCSTSMLNVDRGSEFDLIAGSDEQTAIAAGRRSRARRRGHRRTAARTASWGSASTSARRWASSRSGQLSLGRVRRRGPRLRGAQPGRRASSSRRSTSSGPSAAVGGDRPFDASAFASRLIVGAVFGVLIFITIVIYGMWVAPGVVAEKASRVMELLDQRGVDAAARHRQGARDRAGRRDADAIVLVPAILVLLLGGSRSPTLVLGPGRRVRGVRVVAVARRCCSRSPCSTSSASPCTRSIYAAAGSLVSRPEDLQIIALPL